MNTLNHWIQGYQEKPTIPTKYWYLEWLEGKSPSCLKWTTSLPDGCNIVRTINLRVGPKLVVCGKLYHQKPKHEPFFDLSDIEKGHDYREFTNEALLKSHLQKCVRRQQDTRAVLTAFHLMRLDFPSFCRRFPIIAVEDANLHTAVAVVIWFMTANPGKLLSLIHVRYFLGLVLNITNGTQYDRAVGQQAKSLWKIEMTNLDLWERCETLACPKLKNLLLSLIVRKCYGGMKCDMVMLSQTCQKWMEIGALQPYMETPCRQIKIKNYLGITNFTLEGVDFHCFPNVVYKIQERHPKLSHGQIKNAIWKLSSSINYRLASNKAKLDPEVIAHFNLIRDDYFQLAKQLLVHWC